MHGAILNRMEDEMKVVMSECTRQNTCFDCDSERCLHKGRKEADCPKYRCDRPGGKNCDHCDFIDDFIERERKWYRENG